MKEYIKPITEDLRLVCDADLMYSPGDLISGSGTNGTTGGW